MMYEQWEGHMPLTRDHNSQLHPKAVVRPTERITSVFSALDGDHRQIEVLRYATQQDIDGDLLPLMKQELTRALCLQVANALVEGCAVAVRIGYVETEPKQHIVAGALLLTQRAVLSVLRSEHGEVIREHRSW